VGNWLRSLGLGQYDAAFRASEIDAAVLSDLTDADLEKLGVPSGHRKRLLKAIANLGAVARVMAAAGAATPAPVGDTAERRQVPVMFIDTVGSTALFTLQPSSVANHFEALHAAGLTALVGREEEGELLLRRWTSRRRQ